MKRDWRAASELWNCLHMSFILAVMGAHSVKMKWLGGGLHMACAPQRDESGKALLSGYIIFVQCACRDVTLMDVTAECAMDGWGLPR